MTDPSLTGLGRVLLAKTSRRQLIVRSGAVAAMGLLLAACGSDDDDEPEADPTNTTAPAADPEPTSEADAEGDPTEESDEPTEGTDEPTEESSEGDDSPDTAETPPSDSEEVGRAPAEEPGESGGILALTIDEDPPHFDIHQAATLRVVHPTAPCYNQLVQTNPFDWDEVIPDLAESWEISDDGLTTTFTLREGVTFHHGKPFTAEDVKATFDLVRNPPENFTSPRQDLFETVTDIEVDGDYTVNFITSRPTAALVSNLSSNYMPVYPKDILDEKGEMRADLSGTGPFRLKEYIEGVSVELERNPDYHVPDRPYLDGIIFYIIPDVNTALSSLLSGQLHMLSVDTRGEADQAEQAGGFTIQTVHVLSTNSIEMNSAVEPWENPLIREAASLVVDRHAAIELLTEDFGVVSGPMYPFGPWALSEEEVLAMPGYGTDKEADIARALELMAEAGYPDGFDAEILTRTGQENIAIFIADQLAKIGINVTLDVVDYATFGERTASRDFELIGTSQGYVSSDPDAIYGQGFLCEAARNYGGICVEGLQELHEQQSSELDYEARQEIVREMDQLIIENNVKVIMGFRVTWYLRNDRVHNYARHASQYVNEKHQETWLSS